MTCRELIEFLDRYFEEDLTPEERAEFDRHLAVCEACVRFLDQYSRTVALGCEAFEETAGEDTPAELPDELVQAILAAQRRPR